MERKEFIINIGLSVPGLLISSSLLGKTADNFFSDSLFVKNRISLTIAPVQVEIAKGLIIETIGYNGSVPGPVLKMKEGEKVAVDVFNETNHTEIVHWHGQHLPVEVDGSIEEGTPPVEANSHRQYVFEPGPSGTQWYHTHMHTKGNKQLGTYSGQHGIVFIEPKDNPGRYDKEVFLISHEWFISGRSGLKKDFKSTVYTLNGKTLGFGPPIQVKEGETLMLRLVNGNAKEEIKFACSGHKMKIIGMDGNNLSRPNFVDEVHLGSGERVDILIKMDNPGRWIFGDPKQKRRDAGLGVIIEYPNKVGEPKWQMVKKNNWDYTIFSTNEKKIKPVNEIDMIFDRVKKKGKSVWRVNGKPFSEQKRPFELTFGETYRLHFHNKNKKSHPLHLHRHSFELVNIEGIETSGIFKDTVLIKPNGYIAVDFKANQKGLTLFHCHMQNHMENGFMSLFNCK